MKKIVLASSVALFTACFYVWGSKPAGHIGTAGQNLCKTSVSDTVPRKRDTMTRRDTMVRRDSSR